MLRKHAPHLAERHTGEERIGIPLQESFRLLSAVAPDSPVVQAYRQSAEALEKLGIQRNHSLLAHGFEPVSEDAFQKYYNLVLQFLGLDEEDVPQFPVFEREAIVFWRYPETV